MLLSTDVGYIALLAFLVVVPSVAVGAAVVDRMIKRRRDGILQRPLSPYHAFPVIADPNARRSGEPLRVLPGGKLNPPDR